ncbi:DUF2938 family protein [Pendulispora albinea]|uniref:DUF2938 family protein n=2 Tax=Pendulispora albinea TaxID=2741071 RepID=A0ABZ2LMP6_9BACT
MVILGGISRSLGLIAGVGATLMAKWFNLVLHGQPFVDDVRTAMGEPLPTPLAVLIHLAIGAGFAVLFGLGVRRFGPPGTSWSSSSSWWAWWPAVVFGVATSIANGFLTFPGMGFGIFGVDGPPEMMMIRTNLVMHLYYGLGLALAARFLCSPARISGGTPAPTVPTREATNR